LDGIVEEESGVVTVGPVVVDAVAVVLLGSQEFALVP